MSFIEKFGKNLTYDNIKRQLFFLYGKYVFGKTIRGGLSNSLLRVKYHFCYKILQIISQILMITRNLDFLNMTKRFYGMHIGIITKFAAFFEKKKGMGILRNRLFPKNKIIQSKYFV